MNIISNCCAGGYIYRDFLKIKYPNPFIWCKIKFTDYYALMQNYKTIDFENAIPIRFKDYIDRKDCPDLTEYQYNTNVGLMIDDKIKIFWPHNLFSPNDKTPRIQDCFAFSDKNWIYTLENWNKRLIRSNIKDDPTWVILTQQNKQFTIENTTKLLNDFQNEKIIVFTSFRELFPLATPNHKIYFNRNVERNPNVILHETRFSLDF